MYTKIVQNIDLGNGVTVNSGNCLKRGVNVFSPGRNSLSYILLLTLRNIYSIRLYVLK